MIGLNVADQYALAITKDLGLGNNFRPSSAGHSLSCVCPPWLAPSFFFFNSLTYSDKQCRFFHSN